MIYDFVGMKNTMRGAFFKEEFRDAAQTLLNMSNLKCLFDQLVIR